MFYIFILLAFCSLTLANKLVCETINSVKYHVKWPKTSTKTASNPFCLNNNREFVYRECIDGFWAKEPECVFVQQQNQPQCPERFVDTGNICYIFSNSSKFPPKCPFEDVLPFDTYKNQINNFSNPIWMPIYKDPKTGVFQWMEASTMYKKPFEDNFYLFGSSKNKDCLLFYNTSYIVAASCEEDHINVCAYDQFKNLNGQLCGAKCQRSDFSQDSKCFCEGEEKNLKMHAKAEFRKPYQSYSRTNCTFGLEKTSTGYIWTNSQTEIEYTFWNNKVVFDDDHIYGAVTPNGWLLTTQNLDCIIYETLPITLRPSLHLNLKDNVFRLSIGNVTALKFINGKPLIVCFFNSKSLDLIHRHEFGNSIYEFYADRNLSGEYWCEAFKYSNLEAIQSNKVVIQEIMKNPKFVGIFKLNNILNNNEIKRSIPNLLFEILNEKFGSIKHYDKKIMSIMNINTEHKSILFNAHFTYNCSNCYTTNVDEEYISLKTSINSMLNNDETSIILEDFRPFDYCLSYQSKIFWPKTEAGLFADIKDFCFAQGMQIQRECLHDTIYGAQWSPENDCEIMEQSRFTNKLKILLDEAPDDICFSLRQLVQNYQSFEIIDLHLTEEILNKCVEFEEDEMLINFLLVYDVLMNLKKTMLEQAELKMWVTSSLLYTFFYPYHRSYKTILPIIQNNFVYTKSHISALTGIALQQTVYKRKAIYLTKEDNIVDILKIQNFDSAILLNPHFCDQLNQSGPVSFSILFNNGFFLEDKEFSKNPRKIFSVSFEENHDDFDDAIWILSKKSQTDKAEYICAIWTYGEKIGWWKALVLPEIYKSFYLCKLPAQSDAYYSLINLDSLVTDALNELIQCDCSATQLLEGLQEISNERYSDFTPRDVYFAAKILEKVSFSDEFDLEMVVAIMSNLDKISRNVLEESEMTEGATTLILNYFSILLQKYKLKDSIRIERLSVMLYGVLLEDANLYGLVKFDDSIGTVSDVNLNNVLNDYFDVVILLSASLRTQLNKNDKIIVTMFENSALFQSTSSISPIGTIIGAYLPFNNYTGPIYIFHKLSKIQTSKCVSWSHNTPDTLSSWQIMAQGEIMSDLIMCKIWNNSHVALITYDDNSTYQISLDLVTTVNSGISFIALSTLAITYDKKNVFLFYVAINNIFHLILLDFSKRLFSNVNKICTTVTSTSLQHSSWFFYTILATLVISQNKSLLSKLNNSIGKFIFSWICALLFFLVSSLLNSRSCYGFTTGLYLYTWHPISLTFAMSSFILSFLNFQKNVINDHLKLLFGVTLALIWMFGINANIGVYKYFFIYLFSSFTTLQGLIIVAIVIISSTNYSASPTRQKSKKKRSSPFTLLKNR